ncbi:hypothetical protein RYX36_024788 [Vicia faba]
MKKGEICIIDYCSRVFLVLFIGNLFLVFLISFSSLEKESWDMRTEEKNEAAAKKKEGNVLFKDGTQNTLNSLVFVYLNINKMEPGNRGANLIRVCSNCFEADFVLCSGATLS